MDLDVNKKQRARFGLADIIFLVLGVVVSGISIAVFCLLLHIDLGQGDPAEMRARAIQQSERRFDGLLR